IPVWLSINAFVGRNPIGMSNSGTSRNRVLTRPMRTAAGSDRPAEAGARFSATTVKSPIAATTAPHLVHIHRFMASHSWVAVPVGLASRLKRAGHKEKNRENPGRLLF